VIPRGTVPTLNQLEARIDEAVVIARASEDGVREVGEMALDAARQARRAAEAAEASAKAAAVATAGAKAAEEPIRPEAAPRQARPAGAVARRPTPTAEARIRSFNERADRLLARASGLCRGG
jgi:hypothetical protein